MEPGFSTTEPTRRYMHSSILFQWDTHSKPLGVDKESGALCPALSVFLDVLLTSLNFSFLICKMRVHGKGW